MIDIPSEELFDRVSSSGPGHEDLVNVAAVMANATMTDENRRLHSSSTQSAANTMNHLASNRELYEYLLRLAGELKSTELDELSEAVLVASRHAAGLSTEFLGESRIALQRVLNEEKGALTSQQRSDVSDTLTLLHRAFDRR